MWKKRERSKPELDRPGGSQANSPEAHEQQRGSADKPSGAAPLLPCCSCRRRQRRSRARRGRRRRTSIGGRYRFLSRLDENVLRACNRAAVCCAGAEELLRSLGILVLPEKVCHNIASCATTTNLCSAVLKGVSYLCALNLHVSNLRTGLLFADAAESLAGVALEGDLLLTPAFLVFVRAKVSDVGGLVVTRRCADIRLTTSCVHHRYDATRVPLRRNHRRDAGM